MTEDEGPKLVYFAPDRTDAAVRRRVCTMRDAGYDVQTFSFRRHRYNALYQPDWHNTDLGVTQDGSYLSRLFKVPRTIATMVANRKALLSAEVLYARNMDMALLALLGRSIARSKATFVYEVLDIRPVLVGNGIISMIARYLERIILARSQLLVVSSPAFVDHFYQPVQGVVRNWALVENKLQAMPELADRPQTESVPDEIAIQPVWTIGWFGTIRCQESLTLLTGLAKKFPRTVRIVIRGFAARIGEEKFLQTIRECPNISYEGEYQAPDDLQEMYAGIHLNWCVDLADSDFNSRFLLPNRIYEGGYFGVPALAIGASQTGALVLERDLGWTIAAPFPDSLADLLESLSTSEYLRKRYKILSDPSDWFVDNGEFARAMLSIAANSNPTVI